MEITCNVHKIKAMDSCPQCELENPYWRRCLSIHIEVVDSWLDPERVGTVEDRAEGWSQILEDIKKAIKEVQRKYSGGPTVDVGWETDPEVA